MKEEEGQSIHLPACTMGNNREVAAPLQLIIVRTPTLPPKQYGCRFQPPNSPLPRLSIESRHPPTSLNIKAALYRKMPKLLPTHSTEPCSPRLIRPLYNVSKKAKYPSTSQLLKEIIPRVSYVKINNQAYFHQRELINHRESLSQRPIITPNVIPPSHHLVKNIPGCP